MIPVIPVYEIGKTLPVAHLPGRFVIPERAKTSVPNFHQEGSPCSACPVPLQGGICNCTLGIPATTAFSGVVGHA